MNFPIDEDLFWTTTDPPKGYAKNCNCGRCEPARDRRIIALRFVFEGLERLFIMAQRERDEYAMRGGFMILALLMDLERLFALARLERIRGEAFDEGWGEHSDTFDFVRDI